MPTRIRLDGKWPRRSEYNVFEDAWVPRRRGRRALPPNLRLLE